MNKKKTHSGVLALVALIALLLAAYALPPLSKPKARPSRVTGVKNISSVAMTIPSTNALPTATSNK